MSNAMKTAAPLSPGNSQFIHLGCGNRLLPGFLNIDMAPPADLVHDIRTGLPFNSESIDVVYSEHFIEHLDFAEALNMLRECRRILRPGGIVRISTPDLKRMADAYLAQEPDPDDWLRFGGGWKRTPCERLNIGMRWWDHKFIFDRIELSRVGILAGLAVHGYPSWGKSELPTLQNLEYRSDASLIVEFVKPNRRLADNANPLVTIAIPAYKNEFFGDALDSAIQQTYEKLEILVCDDSTSDDIERTTRMRPDSRIRFVRNAKNIGGKANFAQCLKMAEGEFVKFLCDDDVLAPDCVETLLEGFRRYPDITLSFSKRDRIDERGSTLVDDPCTQSLSTYACAFDGRQLAGAAMLLGRNFIGEPSTVLFRKAELSAIAPHYSCFAGHENIRVVDDLAAWHNLLSKGDAAYCPRPLSKFRIHANQRQKAPDIQALAAIAWPQLLDGSKRHGFTDSVSEAIRTRKCHHDWQQDKDCTISRQLAQLPQPVQTATSSAATVKSLAQLSQLRERLAQLESMVKGFIKPTMQPKPADPDLLPKLPDGLIDEDSQYQVALALIDRNNLDGAQAILESLASNGTMRWEVFNALGKILIHRGKPERAFTFLRIAAGLEKNSSEASRNLAAAYAINGEFAQALAVSSGLLAADPESDVNLGLLRDIVMAANINLDDFSWISPGISPLLRVIDQMAESLSQAATELDELLATYRSTLTAEPQSAQIN